MAALSGLAGSACSDDAGATPAADAGSEQTPRPDTFCFTRPALEFCEDFDVTALPAAFADLRETGGSAIVEPKDPASAPNSALFSAKAGEGALDTRLEKTFDVGVKYRVFVQMREVTRSTNAARKSSVRVLGLRFAGQDDYEVGIATDESGGWFGYEIGKGAGEGGAGRTFPATKPLDSMTKWTSVRIDMDVTANGTGTLLIRFGDTSVVSGIALTPPFARAAPVMRLGVWDAAGAHDGWGFRFDNVTFQVD